MESAFVIDTSAEPGGGGGGVLTVVSWVELLFEPSGSPVSEDALAVFEIVPPGCAGFTVTSIVTVQVAPFARDARSHVTSFPVVAHDPPPSWTVFTISDPGTESETATFVAASGPLLETKRS